MAKLCRWVSVVLALGASCVASGAAAGCSSTKAEAVPPDTGLPEEDTAPPVCTLAVGKGPWALAFDETHAKVRWEACVAGPGGLTLQPEGGGAARKIASKVTETKVTETIDVPLVHDADWAGTYWMHEVAIDGLSADSCYTYVLDTDATAKGRFCTSRSAAKPFTFTAVGDTNPGFASTAFDQMLDKVYSPRKLDFTIHMGDIQYYASGLETYGLWFGKLAPMLRAGALQVVIGNHEFERPTERMEYVERYFGGSGIEGMKSWYRFHSGGVWFFALDSEADGGLGPASEQGKWFLAQLDDASKKPGYRFSVVYMHRPMATCGDVSENDTDRKAYQPTFEKLGVKFVLAGHLHVYERFELGEVTYITTGGGGAALMQPDANLTRESCASRKSAGRYFHQVVFEVKAGEVSGTVIDSKGDVRDTFTRVVP